VSRLFIYYNGRVKENGNDDNITDSGCTMTSAIEALEELGVCLESLWPYDISQVNARPSDESYQQAKPHKISEALQVNIDLNEMKSCLAQGFPFAFGLKLFSSFDQAAHSGVVPMPSTSDRGRQSDGRSLLLN
jgi:C1A family cysteine protease